MSKFWTLLFCGGGKSFGGEKKEEGEKTVSSPLCWTSPTTWSVRLEISLTLPSTICAYKVPKDYLDDHDILIHFFAKTLLKAT